MRRMKRTHHSSPRTTLLEGQRDLNQPFILTRDRKVMPPLVEEEEEEEMTMKKMATIRNEEVEMRNREEAEILTTRKIEKWVVTRLEEEEQELHWSVHS